MGKINEYQRKTLVSTAVGVASADKSGQIVGGATQKFGNVMVAQAQKIDQYDTVQANASVMQFGLAFQKLGTQTQREMAANPMGYADRLMETGTDLLNAYAGSIEDPGVRGKFMTAGQTILKAGVLQAPAWSMAKKKDNVEVSINTALETAIVATGETLTIAGYEDNMKTFNDEILGQLSDEDYSADKKAAFMTENGPTALKAHLYNMIDSGQAKQVKSDLAQGKYKNASFYSNDIKVTFMGKATTKINRDEKLLRDNQTETYYALDRLEQTGQLTVAAVTAARINKDPNRRISEQDATRLYGELIEKSVYNAAGIEKENPRAEKYVSMVEDVFSNKIERAVVLDKIIGLYSDGDINPTEKAWLANFAKDIKETKQSKLAQEATTGTGAIKDSVTRIWGPQATTRTAGYVRAFIKGMSDDIPPQNMTRIILNDIRREKVIEDDPNLAGFDDPVTESYRRQAIDELSWGGYKVDDKRIETLVNNYRSKEYGGK